MTAPVLAWRQGAVLTRRPCLERLARKQAVLGHCDAFEDAVSELLGLRPEEVHVVHGALDEIAELVCRRRLSFVLEHQQQRADDEAKGLAEFLAERVGGVVFDGHVWAPDVFKDYLLRYARKQLGSVGAAA